jgi:hypothetical protein
MSETRRDAELFDRFMEAVTRPIVIVSDKFSTTAAAAEQLRSVMDVMRLVRVRPVRRLPGQRLDEYIGVLRAQLELWLERRETER